MVRSRDLMHPKVSHRRELLLKNCYNTHIIICSCMYVSFTHNELGIQLQLYKQLEEACTCVITMYCQLCIIL